MNTCALCFDQRGSISGFYTEAIDLAVLGSLHITRASAIEFDNEQQCWRVYSPMGECLFHSPSRQECLHWEAQHLTHSNHLPAEQA